MEQIIVNKIEGQIEILSLVFILTLLAKNYWKVKKLMKIFLIENES
jgi:hypothetical protein